jgi:hypothetical protein
MIERIALVPQPRLCRYVIASVFVVRLLRTGYTVSSSFSSMTAAVLVGWVRL